MVTIGTCVQCIFRYHGYCTNDDKIHEDDWRQLSEEEKKDHLIYSYYEGGGFVVGENFGCIHWRNKE